MTKAAYVVLGINIDGKEDILGWLIPTENLMPLPVILVS